MRYDSTEVCTVLYQEKYTLVRIQRQNTTLYIPTLVHTINITVSLDFTHLPAANVSVLLLKQIHWWK